MLAHTYGIFNSCKPRCMQFRANSYVLSPSLRTLERDISFSFPFFFFYFSIRSSFWIWRRIWWTNIFIFEGWKDRGIQRIFPFSFFFSFFEGRGKLLGVFHLDIFFSFSFILLYFWGMKGIQRVFLFFFLIFFEKGRVNYWGYFIESHFSFFFILFLDLERNIFEG